MDDDDLANAIHSALVDGDFAEFEKVLHPRVMWGHCATPQHIVSMVTELQASGLAASAIRFDQLADHPDRIGVSLDAEQNGTTFQTHHTLFLEGELIVEIVDVADADAFATARRLGPFESSASPVRFDGVAPVLPVTDVSASLVLYAKLGFETESYGGDADYGFLRRDQVQLHLAQVSNLDPKTTTSAVYLYVDDARALYAQWRDAKVDGRLIPPEHTDYGLCEGAYIDPDNNLLRFGSPS